jgi:hypothetical protein
MLCFVLIVRITTVYNVIKMIVNFSCGKACLCCVPIPFSLKPLKLRVVRNSLIIYLSQYSYHLENAIRHVTSSKIGVGEIQVENRDSWAQKA